MKKLPVGWENLPLSEIASRTFNVDPSGFPQEIFELYSVPSFSTGVPDQLRGNEIKSSKQAVEPGDVLLCKIVPHLNRVWKVGAKGSHRQIASGEWIVYRDHHSDPDYLRYCLSEGSFRDQFMTTVAGVGGSLMRARPFEVAKIEIPLAPFPEQRRIVAKIDSLSTKSKRASDELDHVPQLVKKYKQAILTAAFRGELTERWRQERNVSAEWQSTTIGRISEIRLGKMLDKARNKGADTPYLRNINVRWGHFEVEDILTMRMTDVERRELDVRDGDIFVCEGGEPGRAAVWRLGPTNVSFQKALLRVRPNEKFSSEFIARYLEHVTATGFLVAFFTGTTIKHLPLIALSRVPIKVPSYPEQIETVRRVEAAFAWINRLLSEATSARKLIDHLDQAVLARAFRGELVPQDPNDEPASVLSERIKAGQRATSTQRAKTKQHGTKH